MLAGYFVRSLLPRDAHVSGEKNALHIYFLISLKFSFFSSFSYAVAIAEKDILFYHTEDSAIASDLGLANEVISSGGIATFRNH